MLTIAELRSISAARLEDAQALFDAGRYDAASYLCGYALELALKAKVCETLNWEGFPETGSEFKDYRSFKTHDLDVLLHLSGVEARILEDMEQEWRTVQAWNSERWYDLPGRHSEQSVGSILSSSREILRVLWNR